MNILESEFLHHLGRFCAIRDAGCVSEVNDLLMREQFDDLLYYGQPPDTGVKDTYRSVILCYHEKSRRLESSPAASLLNHLNGLFYIRTVQEFHICHKHGRLCPARKTLPNHRGK